MSSRMNKSASINGRPSTRKPDLHGQAVREALAEGLGEYAPKHPTTGEPMLFSAKDRRIARQRKAQAELIDEAADNWEEAKYGTVAEYGA